MALFFELITTIIIGTLDALGGYHWLFARRYILPFVLGIVVSFISSVWWLGFLVLPAMGTFTLGYPDQGKNAGRGLWLFIQAVALSLGLTLTGHLAINWGWMYMNQSWVIFSVYVVLAGVLGGLYKNWKQIFGDVITGIYLGSIIFFVH